MENTLIVVLIVCAALVLALLIGGFVVLLLYLLSKGGWGQLKQRYRVEQPPSGAIVRRQTVKVGLVTFKQCITVGIADEGLYLSMWRTTVLIPWSELSAAGETQFFWRRVPVLAVGQPQITTLTFEHGLIEKMQTQFAG